MDAEGALLLPLFPAYYNSSHNKVRQGIYRATRDLNYFQDNMETLAPRVVGLDCGTGGARSRGAGEQRAIEIKHAKQAFVDSEQSESIFSHKALIGVETDRRGAAA
jgi:hypothetical protein